jgi:hypothetical protein
LPVRALGGVAIALTVPTGVSLLFPRPYRDIDLIVAKGRQDALADLLSSSGYVPDEEFNAFNSHRRLLFYDAQHGRQLDAFVEVFAMCHEVPLKGRLAIPGLALPPPDLLMTKLQIVELNDKDMRDIFNLLYSQPHADPAEALGLPRIAACCAADWGLWRTACINIERAQNALPDLPLTDEERDVLQIRLRALMIALDTEPKTRRWKLRARLGDRVRWYEEPEEVA